MSKVLRVTRKGNELRSAAQLTFQFEDALVLSTARNRWRQIICNDAYAAFGSYRQRRRF